MTGKPRVLIDARMVSEIPHGIARYVTQMAQGLKLSEKLPYEPVFLTQPNLQNETRQKFFAGFETQTIHAPFLSPQEVWEIPRFLSKSKAALYHSVSFSSLWTCPCPSVITLHDLNHLHYGGISKKLYYQILLKRFSRRSKKILTVSQFSQNEIARWLGIPRQEIEITYNAITRSPDSRQGPSIRELNKKAGLNPENKNYFFCLSNSKPHKNLNLLIQAYEIFRSKEPQAWPLLISTQSPQISPDGVSFLGPLSEEFAQGYLRNATALLFPSLYEGFGLPPIEAALLGIPLAVSQIPPHQEGLADLDPAEVHWVPPTDLSGWVKAFQILFQQEIRPSSSETQDRILARFNVAKLGSALDSIYRRALGDST